MPDFLFSLSTLQNLIDEEIQQNPQTLPTAFGHPSGVLCKMRKAIWLIRLDAPGGWHRGGDRRAGWLSFFEILHPEGCATGSFCRSPDPVCQAG